MKEHRFVNKLIEGHEAEQKNVMKKMKKWKGTKLKQFADAAIATCQWELLSASTVNAIIMLDIPKISGLEMWY